MPCKQFARCDLALVEFDDPPITIGIIIVCVYDHLAVENCDGNRAVGRKGDGDDDNVAECRRLIDRSDLATDGVTHTEQGVRSA